MMSTSSVSSRWIPVSRPWVGEHEVELVSAAVRDGWISSGGPYVERFESAWAQRCERRHGVAVANGTVALELALAALEIGPGDEVIMPALTLISCGLAAVRRGAVPVVVDVDPTTWCMDMERVREAMGPRTRAVMPVHLYGHPADMESLQAVVRNRDVAVVEDAAEAQGAEYRCEGVWRPCGSLTTISTFSFYANKLVTTGEGGMVVTDDSALADAARSLRDLAHDPNRRFRHERLGYNFRLGSLQAALGIAHLERLEETIARKRAIAARYDEAFRDLDGIQRPPRAPGARGVFWMYAVVLDRDAGPVIDSLAARGVEARPFFVGLHEQPALRGHVRTVDASLPITELVSRRGLYLPSGPVLADGELDASAQALREVITG